MVNDIQFTNNFLINEEFPNFKGENSTNSSISFEMNGHGCFLIPPKTKFYNHDIRDFKNIETMLSTKYDFIVIDPPWKNRYIRRIKKSKREFGYKMLQNDEFLEIPLQNLIKTTTIVAIWCTNSLTHQKYLTENLLPSWNLKLFKKIFWIKLNTEGNVICNFNVPGKKQPYEVLFIALHSSYKIPADVLSQLEYITSIPSVIHSHKPPLFEIFKRYLPENPKCLELFARYLYPGFTSIGLEVLKLMSVKFYNYLKEEN